LDLQEVFFARFDNPSLLCATATTEVGVGEIECDFRWVGGARVVRLRDSANDSAAANDFNLKVLAEFRDGVEPSGPNFADGVVFGEI